MFVLHVPHPCGLRTPMNSRPLSSASLRELINAYIVLSACSRKSFVRCSSKIFEKLTSSPLKSITIPIVRQTFFRHFCAGETISDAEKTLIRLEKNHDHGILDYAAESNSRTLNECYFNTNASRIESTIKLASKHPGTLVAIKLSSLMPYQILHTTSISLAVTNFGNSWLIHNYKDKDSCAFYERVQKIARLAQVSQVELLFDAENIEIQPAIDYFAIRLMQQYNSLGRLVICNTYQMYLEKGLERLKQHLKLSNDQGFTFGLKLVRGAYLRTDQNKSAGPLYGPILSNIDKTHSQYDQAIEYLLGNNFENLSKIMIASHNEKSVDLSLNLLEKNNELSRKVMFAQLLGMASEIAFRVKSTDSRNYKYLPFGPIEMTVPYLARRAQENADVLRNGQELRAILQELVQRIKS